MLIDVKDDLVFSCQRHPSEFPESIVERALNEYLRAHLHIPTWHQRIRFRAQRELGRGLAHLGQIFQVVEK